MLAWLFELLTSFVTFVLGFFGIDYKKKTVSFADETEVKPEESTPSDVSSTTETAQE